MRFVHVADVHLGYQQYGSKERFNDFSRVFLHIVEQAIERQVGFLLLAGDLFHKRSVDPLAMRVAIAGLQNLSAAGIPMLAVEGDETYLPYPAFVLIEEAHNFAPASADLVSSRILKTILSEGRKFGVAVGLISQRPGKLDADVLSQCMTQFILRIVNPVDQARVAESVESVGRDLLKELPALSKGQAIVAGAAVNTPVLCRVRRRITEHGAEDVDAPARWLEWFEKDRSSQCKRDQALPFEPETRGRSKLFKA